MPIPPPSQFDIFLQGAVYIFLFSAVTAGVFFLGQWVMSWYEVYEGEYVQRAEEDLYGMFMTMPPQRVLQATFLCFTLGFLIVLLLIGNYDTTFASVLTISISLAAGFAASLIPKFLIKRAGLQRLKLFDLQLLDSLLSMSNALKAGFSILQAFESVVQEKTNPISQEYDLFLREVRLGVKFEVASENLMKRVPSDDLQIVLTGIETARQTGGNLTEVFDRLAMVIRERMKVQGRIQALTAQGRMQGKVMALLPFVMGYAFYRQQPEMMMAFLTSVPGMFSILIILVLIAVATLMIRKIVNIDV
jgi:tight adherence protein B